MLDHLPNLEKICHIVQVYWTTSRSRQTTNFSNHAKNCQSFGQHILSNVWIHCRWIFCMASLVRKSESTTHESKASDKRGFVSSTVFFNAFYPLLPNIDPILDQRSMYGVWYVNEITINNAGSIVGGFLELERIRRPIVRRQVAHILSPHHSHGNHRRKGVPPSFAKVLFRFLIQSLQGPKQGSYSISYLIRIWHRPPTHAPIACTCANLMTALLASNQDRNETIATSFVIQTSLRSPLYSKTAHS